MAEARRPAEEDDARTIWRGAVDLAAETVWVVDDLRVTKAAG